MPKILIRCVVVITGFFLQVLHIPQKHVSVIMCKGSDIIFQKYLLKEGCWHHFAAPLQELAAFSLPFLYQPAEIA